MKLWMCKAVVWMEKPAAACDTVLLAGCWLLGQAVLARITWAAWGSDASWRGPAAAVFFGGYTAMLWGFILRFVARYPYSASDGDGPGKHKREVAFFG